MHGIRLASIVRVFTWIGVTSLGGARSAYFHDALVFRRSWVTNEEFLQDLTLAQIVPGSNFSNLAVALGCRLAGLAGGLGALLAIVVPGAVALVALAALYFSRGLWPGAVTTMRGMAAAVVGLVLLTTGRLVISGIRDRRALLVAGMTFVAVGPLHLNTALTIGVVGALSVWLNRPGAVGAAPR